MEWLTDSNGNKCSVEYFGTRELAQSALDSLKECRDCVNCSRCSGCSDCSDCSRCSDCSDCSDCSRCSGLNDAAPTVASTSNVPVVPTIENLHQKIYEAVSQPNALDMGAWHMCETTHCRAGWVIQLGGEQGKALERFFDTPLAAMKIYDASCPGYKINPVRFHDSDEDALEDMRKLAEAEAASAK